jgi:ABC-type lipoprotein export system ATPase subunit
MSNATAPRRPHIECTDLVRIFSGDGVEVQALQGLTLRVGEGELIAIVGASGSGKSTLLSILSGLDVPTAGTVRVAGHALLAMRGIERTAYRRRTVGFVWQQTARNLVPYFTVIENVASALAVAHHPRKRRRERIAQVLEPLGLADIGDRLPGQLSGGQQQRAAIAVALANEPEVLFADEPTGELDARNSELVLDAMREVNERLGVTVLIVTHDSGVSSHVRRTVQIRDGRTSTEVHRSTRTNEFGRAVQHAEEFAVLDRVGRLQLPPEYLTALDLRDRVRLDLESDRVEVRPSGAGSQDAGNTDADNDDADSEDPA